MKTLIGAYDEFTAIVNLNEGDTFQTAIEIALEKLEDITGYNVNSSDVSWYSAEKLNVGKIVTYTLE